MAVVAAAALALGACGGDDDDDAGDSTTSAPAGTGTDADDTATTPTNPTSSTSSTSTSTSVPDEPEYVTEGATVVVANASGINGAAGRMSERLAAVGFGMGEATNSSEGQLETTKVYFDPANENAQPVAESVRAALGGGDIQLFEMGVPAPVDGGDIGDATVLVAMGNDTSDRSLDELQGRAPATEDDGDTTGDTTSDDTTGDTTGDTTSDDTTGDTTGDG